MIVQLLLLELLHAFGICLLVFRVLPVTDFFRGITITMATFTLPSLFKLILLERKPKAGFWDCMKLIGAILAFLTQVNKFSRFLKRNPGLTISLQLHIFSACCKQQSFPSSSTHHSHQSSGPHLDLGI